GLRIEDVFGLATQLRAERGCDVLFILNEEKLGDRSEGYAAHIEKTVDHRVRYEPSPEYAFDLVLPDVAPLFQHKVLDRSLVRGCCLSLEITNLRVLQRLTWSLGEIAPLLNGRHGTTIRDAVRAVVLYSWA